MPIKPLHPCNKLGCNALTRERYCETHKSEVRRYDRERASAAERGYDSRWQKYRIAFLRKNPFCAECERNGRFTPATIVDHITPHKGSSQLFWDQANHQPLCMSCHNAKTAREDMGAWSRPRV